MNDHSLFWVAGSVKQKRTRNPSARGSERGAVFACCGVQGTPLPAVLLFLTLTFSCTGGRVQSSSRVVEVGLSSSPAPSAAPSASSSAGPEVGTRKACRNAAECMSYAKEVEDRLSERTHSQEEREEYARDTLAYYREACRFDSAEGCREAAFSYLGYEGPAGSPGCVARYSQRACDLGSLECCTWVAGSLPKDSPRAVTLVQQACDGGFIPACETLAQWYRDGDRVKKDEARAARLFQKFCEAGTTIPGPAATVLAARQCFSLAGYLVEGKFVPKDEARAAQYYEQGCSNGAFEACFPLAKLVAAGRGVTRDPARAAELLETACGNSFGVGCDEGAAMFRSGKGVARDLAKAARLEDQSVLWASADCGRNASPGACERIIKAYSSGGVVPLNPAMSLEWIAMTCSLGMPKGCLLAAQKLTEGLWVPKDPARATKLRTRARELVDKNLVKGMLDRECAAGVATDCYLLGEAYRTGNKAWNVPRDEKRGEDLIFQACDLTKENMAIECQVAGGIRTSHEIEKATSKGTQACDPPNN